MMTALLAIQATAHTKDEPEKEEPRTWGQFLDENKWNIAGGAAVAGAGILGYAFRNELMEAFNSMSPAQKEEVKIEIEQSIEQTEQVIEEKQEEVAEQLAEIKEMTESGKHGNKHNKQVAQKEETVAQTEQEIADLNKQVTHKASFLGFITGQNSYKEYQDQVNEEPINDTIKAAYVTKYGKELGIQRYNKEKSANDYLAGAAFATSVGAVIAPTPTAVIALGAHANLPYKMNVNLLKPDYESADNYVQMRAKANNETEQSQDSSTLKTKYAFENPENLSSNDLRDTDADRAQDKEYQQRITAKMKRRVSAYKEQLKELEEITQKYNNAIPSEFEQNNNLNHEQIYNANKEARDSMKALESKYNEKLAASDDQVDKEFNDKSPRTWLSYANPLSPLRNQDNASNDLQSPIDSQAAKNLEGLV